MMDDRATPGDLFMSTLTIHLRDDQHERLEALAKSKSISVDELMIEIATIAPD
jgi:predicted transcriptional regulator